MLRWMTVGLVAVAALAATAREVRRPLPPRRVPHAARTNAVLKAAQPARPRVLRASGAGPACVDVLVAYDRAASLWAEWLGGGVTNFAANAVARMNEAVTNSGIQASLLFRLGGVESVAAVGGTDFDGTLDAVTSGTGEWAAVREARERLGADVAVTLIDTGSAYGTTGLSWALDPEGYEGFSEYAFSVCAIRAVAESHTMTHEVGHLMGAGHSNRQASWLDPGPLLHPYSSGYYFETNGVPCRTIMAYDDDGYGNLYDETPYFSTPGVALAGVPVGTPTNDNARTLRETAAYVASFRSPNFVCLHDETVKMWKPGSGDVCTRGDDGDVWQWCRACDRWVLDAAGFDGARPTYVICHGHANSIDEVWIRDMAEALPSQANVLAVNWGDAADCYLPHDSAYFIPDVADRAVRRFHSVFAIRPELTTFVGHSHGAHVAANIVFDLGESEPVARFVGLDTSTDEFGVHEWNFKVVSWFPYETVSYGPDRWMDDIKSRCRQVEFYKTSWIMSLSREEAYGHYNFVVVGANDLPEKVFDVAREEESMEDKDEIARHSFAHDWFTRTIREPTRYVGLGFNFAGDPKLIGQSGFCGLIRETVLHAPMGCFVTFSGGEEGIAHMSPRYYDWGQVYNLPSPSIWADDDEAFAGWIGSNGRRYDDGILIFNLGRNGETVTMTAIWE